MNSKLQLLILLIAISLSNAIYAERDNAESQRHLSVKYLTGDGDLQDYKEAAKLMLKAAQDGDGVAQYNLGVMYLNSYGFKFSPKEAKYWIKKSYKNPNTPSSVLESVKKDLG